MLVNMRFAVVITVRMKSKRLSGKALLEIEGKPIIEHIIDRVKLAKLPNMIVLCTSVHPDDAVLCEIAKKNGILCFRGSEDDKLARYLAASEKYGFDYMIDVGGDNIFSDQGCIDGIISEFLKNDPDVVIFKDLPLGASPIGLKISAVRTVCEMKSENDTEAYGHYFFNSKLFKITYLRIPELSKPNIRLTIDYPEDFELASRIFSELGSKRNTFPLSDIVKLFERKPELLEINRSAQRKYEENFKTLAKPKVKPKYRANFGF